VEIYCYSMRGRKIHVLPHSNLFAHSWQVVCYRNRSTIGEFETFKVEYHPGSGSFSFLSHNGLYMNANETMWTVESRDVPRSPDESIASHRSWSVYPLLPRSSDEERVAFLGVDNVKGQSEMKLKAKGAAICLKITLQT
jgi:hypothetical protein